MPTLASVGSLKIKVFADDHNPPHFHAVTPDGDVLIGIADFAVMAGRIDRRSLEVALAWATKHQALLEAEWRRLNER
jgi:hypothetical protein